MPKRMPVKNALRKLLRKHEITPYEFWKQTGIGQNTAYRLCNDPNSGPSKRIMDTIYDVFGWLPGDYLVSDDDWDNWVKSLPPDEQAEIVRQAESYASKSQDGRRKGSGVVDFPVVA